MTDVTRRPGGTPLTGGAPLDEGTPRTAQDTGRGAGSPHTAPHPRSGDTPPTGSGRDRTTATDAGKPAAATGTPAGTHTPAHAQHGGGNGSGSAFGSGTHDRLLPHDDTDQLAAQLQHAVAGFVDAPREAVQEADDVLRELADRFAEAVAERRRTLRRSWETAGTAGPGDGQAAAATDTEQLRLALRDYRELADRLLHV
ncbi:hypothetical protein [Streptomyces sp. enrichment culture]|uniref:hypothetical protein n=1 Tax=Streptomyces sp. enrichment culture TaxID=1795815 RepID=UPI003F57274E